MKGYITDRDQYLELFRGHAGEARIGESTPWYLYSEQAADRIKCYIPEARLIAILRHPVERAFSQYLHRVRDGVEFLTDFAEAVRSEPERRDKQWGWPWRYLERGFYAQQLKWYFKRFPKEQILILLYEDFVSQRDATLRQIFEFLKVDPNFRPSTTNRKNESLIPKNLLVHRTLSRFDPIAKAIPGPLGKAANKSLSHLKRKNLHKPKLNDHLFNDLLESYRTDILETESLIERDLSEWLKPRSRI